MIRHRGRLYLFSVLHLWATCADDPHRKETPMERDEIERLAQVRLPLSAQEVHVYTEAGIDTLVLLRLSLEAADLESFLQSAGFATPLHEGFDPFPPIGSANPPWWTPAASAQGRGGTFTTNRRGGKVFVDLSSPGQPVVYLEVFDL